MSQNENHAAANVVAYRNKLLTQLFQQTEFMKDTICFYKFNSTDHKLHAWSEGEQEGRYLKLHPKAVLSTRHPGSIFRAGVFLNEFRADNFAIKLCPILYPPIESTVLGSLRKFKDHQNIVKYHGWFDFYPPKGSSTEPTPAVRYGLALEVCDIGLEAWWETQMAFHEANPHILEMRTMAVLYQGLQALAFMHKGYGAKGWATPGFHWDPVVHGRINGFEMEESEAATCLEGTPSILVTDSDALFPTFKIADFAGAENAARFDMHVSATGEMSDGPAWPAEADVVDLITTVRQLNSEDFEYTEYLDNWLPEDPSEPSADGFLREIHQQWQFWFRQLSEKYPQVTAEEFGQLSGMIQNHDS